VGVCGVVGLLLTGVWHITRIDSFTIDEVVISGGETVPSPEIQNLVDGILQGSYLSLIPRRFTFFYPHDNIANAVLSVPRIKDVSIDRDGKTLSLSFSEHVPFALWCLESDPDSCFFLDAYGYAFAPGPRLAGGALVRHVFENETELSRKQVLNRDALERMHDFLLRLTEEVHMRVTEVRYTTSGDLILTLGGGGELRMRNDESYNSIFNNLSTILTSPEFTHLKPGNFWYIDLRFGNKVFVNEEVPRDTPDESTASTTDAGEEVVESEE
jgi:cell division septal protein FtsQ